MAYNFGDTVSCSSIVADYGISADAYNIYITELDADNQVIATRSFRKGHFTLETDPRNGFVTIVPDPVATALGITAYGQRYTLDFGADSSASVIQEPGFNQPNQGCTTPTLIGQNDYREFIATINALVAGDLAAVISSYDDEANEVFTLGTKGNYVRYRTIAEGEVSSGWLLNVPQREPIFEIENITLGNGSVVYVDASLSTSNDYPVTDTWVIPNTTVSIVSGTNPAAVVVNLEFTAHDNLAESPTYRRRFNVTVKDVNNVVLGDFIVPNPTNATKLTGVSLNLAQLVGLADAKSFTLEVWGSDEIGWQTTPTVAVYEEEVHALIGSYGSNVVGAAGSFGSFVRFGRDAAADGTLETLQAVAAYTGSNVSTAFSGPAIANGQVIAVQMMSALSGGSVVSQDRRRFPTPDVTVDNIPDTDIWTVVSENTTQDNQANTYQTGIYDSDNDTFAFTLYFGSITVNSTIYADVTFTLTGTIDTEITPALIIEQLENSGIFDDSVSALLAFANANNITGTFGSFRFTLLGQLLPQGGSDIFSVSLHVTHNYLTGANLQSVAPALYEYSL